MQKIVLTLALYVSSSLALPAYAGLMGDTVDLSFNPGEFTPVEGVITVNGIADTLIGTVEAAGDVNNIIDSVTLIDADSFSFRLAAGFGDSGTARINLAFAPTDVPEPSTLGLLFLGIGSIFLLRRKTT